MSVEAGAALSLGEEQAPAAMRHAAATAAFHPSLFLFGCMSYFSAPEAARCSVNASPGAPWIV